MGTTRKHSNRISAGLDWLPFVIGLFLVVLRFAPRNGEIGHDYSYYLTRIILGSAHFWQNGWDIPYFTPALVGGIPFFADPQSVYYSVQQLLSFFIEAFKATLLSYFLFYSIAYVSMWELCRRVFCFSSRVSHLCALMFLLNGFAFGHLLVGHVTHHTYLLIPLLMLCLSQKPKRWQALLFWGSSVALLVTYTFFSGGVHVLIVMAGALALFFPVLATYHSQEGSWGPFLRLVCIALLLIALTCSAKLYLGWVYSAYFIQNPLHLSSTNLFELVVRYFWFNPFNLPEGINFGALVYGPWEFTGSVSRVTLVLFPLFVYFHLRKRNRGRWAMVGIYVVLFGGLFLIASGSLSQLPVLRAYHNPIKLLGACLPVMILASGAAVQEWIGRKKLKPQVYLGAALFLLVEFVLCANVFDSNRLVRDFVYPDVVYYQVARQRRIHPIQTLTFTEGRDAISIIEGYSSLSAYEPLFGYRHEKVASVLVEGPTNTVKDGYFNFHHPGCFLFPEEFSCRGWDRIPASQPENFQRFISGDTVSDWVPAWYRWWLRGSFLLIAGLAIYCTGYGIQAIRRAV